MAAVYKFPKFFDQGKNLRQEFKKKFDPHHTQQAERFVWDLFYVPEQYNHLRTPAYHYFSKALYERFHRHLVAWGRNTLGCHDISPTWLSLYLDGHHQNLHTDAPHGPWAFVYSLSPSDLVGGNTLVLKDSVLDFWNTFEQQPDQERHELFEIIKPKFNQLVVFDPRIPHGVQTVRHAQNPLQGRLVIHGWFVNPRPFVVGPLSPGQIQKTLDQHDQGLGQTLDQLGPCHGFVSLKIKISAAGQCTDTKIMASTLKLISGSKREPRALALIKKWAMNLYFPKQRGPSTLTLPLMFKSQ